MRTHIFALAALAMLMAPTLALVKADEMLNDFSDITVWKPNPDGGNAPAVGVDREHVHGGASAMRIKYSDRDPHWGNLTGPCHVPADARALRIWVYVISAAPSAALHIWFMEPDGDAWLQQVRFDDKALGEVEPGWHEARMAISGFNFDPRGTNTRQLTDANRMLIGCNYGDFEIALGEMTWETGPGGAALPLPKTEGLKIETGAKGSIGILDMGEGIPASFKTAHPPAKMAEAVRGAGFGATILKAGDLADAAILTRANFDAVILPFGPYFPQGARATFLAYLKAGGSFLSTDGYAFDKPAILTADGWSAIGPERTAADMDKPLSQGETPMNTRLGQPGDAMGFSPEQIGVFDPQFPLEHATELRAAYEMALEFPTVSHFDTPLTGWAACGLIGVNSPVFPDVYRRWIPILNAYDGQGGGLRGAALAVMHNYAGVYKGSSWAYSGLTSGTDLFLGDAKRRALLGRVLGEITEKVYLHDLTTDFACYEKGETARVSVQVSNFGRAEAERTVELAAGPSMLGDSFGTAAAWVMKKSVALKPGETVTVAGDAPVDQLKDSRALVRAGFLGEGGSGGRDDELWGELCVRDETALASGPKLTWKDNYFAIDGHQTFMVGSNQTGMMFYSPHEGPIVWDKDFSDMAAHNFHVLRILHFSPYAKGGYQGDGSNDALDLAVRPKRLVRQLDAIVQIAQKHRVVIFLCLHDWMPVELSDEQLKVQADWDRFWAERYKNVPGVIFDIQNEPSVGTPQTPAIVKLWNEWLKARYGDDATLRAAWRRQPPEAALPNVPLTATGAQWDNPRGEWDNVRVADRKRFEAEVLNRWVRSNVDGIKAGNPNALACVGYLPDLWNADKLLGTHYTDFSNMHYYGGTEGFATALKIIDRRFVGKGFSVGECGAEEAHNRRTAGGFGLPTDECVDRFQTYLHYAVGMGATYIGNWDWKDFDEMVFPWGLMQTSSGVTKPWLHTWEQGSLFVSFAGPAYESPAVFLLVPDQHRDGGGFGEIYNAMMRSIDLLLDQRVNFGVANEDDLDKLPASAKVMFWPLPYCPTDATFARVLDWVKAGGTLYLSGDVQFDATRQPTRADRRTALGLPAAEAKNPFEAPGDAWGKPAIETAVGKGKVIFAPYPLELRGQAGDADVYRRALKMGGVEATPLKPFDAAVRVLSIPTREGGRLFMLARRDNGHDLLAVTLPSREQGTADGPAAPVTVELAGRGYAFVLVGREGQVLGAESQGAISIAGEKLSSASGHYAICALDGLDLTVSREVLVLPHQCTAVGLAGMKKLKGAGAYVGLPSATDVKMPALLADSVVFSAGTPGQVAIIAPAGRIEADRKLVRDHLALRFAGK